MTRLNIPLFVALAASILSAVPVDARDAHPHQRMIRKRGPPVLDGPGPIAAAAVIGLRVRQAAADPTGSTSQPASSAPVSTTAVASTTREAATSSTSAAAVSTTLVTTSSTAAAVTTTSSSSSTSAAQPTTTSGGLLGSLTAILGSSTTVSTSSVVSSTPVTSATPTTATATATPTSTSTTQVVAPSTTQQQQQPDAETSPTLNIATPSPSATARSPSVSVNVVTSTLAAAAASASVAAAKEKTKKITRNTIVSLVVVASCIGGAIAIWTVIRKWKLSPSEKFDDRMQPIDWAPPPAHTGEAIEEKSKHRRGGSGASHGSFTSGGVGQSEQGHGAKYPDSQQGHGYGPQSQDLPPPHDFTAGTQPGGYGQYYGGQQYPSGPGYADLQRGPSLSESNYSRGADVSRGMSYSRGHGAYDSQSSAVPQMPNPYGGEYGYEDFNHPPAGQQPQAQAPAQGQAPYRTF